MGLFERILQAPRGESHDLAGGHQGASHGHGGCCGGGGHGQHTENAEAEEAARSPSEASSESHAERQHAGHTA